jgi:hypothetical protein
VEGGEQVRRGVHADEFLDRRERAAGPVRSVQAVEYERPPAHLHHPLFADEGGDGEAFPSALENTAMSGRNPSFKCAPPLQMRNAAVISSMTSARAFAAPPHARRR